jgi:type II secretory pathway predicted ATPase ExeA
MYQQYWGLRESPFRGGLDLSLFHATANHDEALARLNFLLEERRRLGLLSGPVGIGKSMLLEMFARQVGDAGGEVVRANLVAADPMEFLWTLAAQFGLNPTFHTTVFALWRRLADHVIESRYQRTQLLVLVDDADAGEPDVLDLIVRLVQLDPHVDSKLTIILATADEQLGQLHPRLLELAELAIALEPWDAADTARYVEFALRQVGRETPLFTRAGVRRLHDLADGIPLRIKQLADLALLAGAGLDLSEIDAETVEGAFQELGVVSTAPLRKSASR